MKPDPANETRRFLFHFSANSPAAGTATPSAAVPDELESASRPLNNFGDF